MLATAIVVDRNSSPRISFSDELHPNMNMCTANPNRTTLARMRTLFVSPLVGNEPVLSAELQKFLAPDSYQKLRKWCGEFYSEKVNPRHCYCYRCQYRLVFIYPVAMLACLSIRFVFAFEIKCTFVVCSSTDLSMHSMQLASLSCKFIVYLHIHPICAQFPQARKCTGAGCPLVLQVSR